MAVQWLPHGKKVLGSILGLGSFCACSLHGFSPGTLDSWTHKIALNMCVTCVILVPCPVCIHASHSMNGKMDGRIELPTI